MTLILCVVFVTFGQSTPDDKPVLPHLKIENILDPSNIPAKCIILDSSGIYWSIFTSDFFGFHEFWTSYSNDAVNWSKALYTGIPVLPLSHYQIRVTNNRFDFDWSGELLHIDKPQYLRASIDTTVLGYTIYKSTLYEDTDADGLSDLAEDMLWTNILKMDTDNDGKADAFDQNPLAAILEKMTIEQKLHKHVIDQELYEFYSNQLVVVEQFQNTPMEYQRETGFILSLSSAACDAFVEVHGYGVPIFSCSLKDTLENKYKVSFQFFVAPDDAWGYDSIYEVVPTELGIKEYKFLGEWIAQ